MTVRRGDPRIAVTLVVLGLFVAVAAWWWFTKAEDSPVLHLRDDRPAADAWIVFEREGGFTGIVDRLVLEEDGRAVVSGTRIRVRTVQLERIRAALAEVDWDEVGNGPGLHPPCCDIIYYQLRHEGHDYVGALMTKEERTLERLVTELGKVIDSARPGRT